MNDFKFSVSMCVYGGDNPEHFNMAVESILNQTKQPNEIIIVVDGPVPEEIALVLKSYETDPIFRIIRLEKNQGHGIARRTGLQNCTNELVAIMDADDISTPDRFELQLQCFAEHTDVDIVGGMITEFIDTTDHVVGKRKVPLCDQDIKLYMQKRCPMNLVTVMFKKSSVEKAGGFIDWYCEEDYYLWIRMAQKGMRFANVDAVLVNVRVGDDMYQRRGGFKYFKSEARLQKYMLDNKIIGLGTYSVNVFERFVLQVLMPNKLRGWVFQKFARNHE